MPIMRSIMMAFHLAVLCLAADVFTSNDPSALPRLLPVHLSHYEHITGVQRRSIDRHWDMEPQSQAQLVWGLQREEDSFTLANMTLRAPPDLPIVLLERFDHMTDHVDCNGDDGEMSLTFKSEFAFRKASNAWKYINEHENHKFLAIANHEGCGPGDERQPYIITNIREDPDSWTTYLTSHPIELHQVAYNFELHFGEFKPSKSPLARRQGPDRTCYFAGPCPQLMSGDPNRPDGQGWNNKDSPYHFDWNKDKTQLFGLLGNNVKISCDQCRTSGTFITSGSAFVENAKLVASTVTGNIQKFKNKFVISIEGGLTDIGLKQSPGMIGNEVTLISEPVPGAGFTIGNVASFGATIEVVTGFFTNLEGRFSMDVTFEGDIDNSALTMDLLGVHPNQFAGATDLNFQKPKWSMRKVSHGANVEGKLGLRASLGFKVGADGSLGQARAEIFVPLPKIQLTFAPAVKDGKNSPGSELCQKDPQGRPRGTIITGKLTTKITGSAKFNPPASDDLTVWSKDLEGLSLDISFPKICVPFDIPGLVSDNSLPGLDSNNGPIPSDNDETADSESNPGDGDAAIANAGAGDAQSSGRIVADANLGSTEDVFAKVAPQTYDLSNDRSDIASNQQLSDPLGIHLANGLSDAQNPSGEAVATSFSGSSFEPGSLPSNTGRGPDQNTNQYAASLPGGGNNNVVVPGGDSGAIPDQAQINANVGTDTLLGNDDNKSGGSKPSTAPLGADSTTSPPSGIGPTVQVAQLSTDNKNNELSLNSALGTGSDPFPSPTVSKRTLMARAAPWFRSITSLVARQGRSEMRSIYTFQKHVGS